MKIIVVFGILREFNFVVQPDNCLTHDLVHRDIVYDGNSAVFFEIWMDRDSSLNHPTWVYNQ